MHKQPYKDLLLIPNLLTCFRFFSAPLLLLFAWQGHAYLFLGLLALTFLSDVLDGMAARLLNQSSEFGAHLDSWADLIIYATIAISTWWLWPHLVKRELFFVLLTIASYVVPVVIGWLKFHAFTSYHTWLVKFAAASMGTSLFLLFMLDYAKAFQLSAMICVLAALEEVAITLYIPTMRSNVRSIWHVMHMNKSERR